MQFPGSMELLKKYQERAKAAGTDPLGYFCVGLCRSAGARVTANVSVLQVFRIDRTYECGRPYIRPGANRAQFACVAFNPTPGIVMLTFT
jgi:hypothetical protein